jgi:predicted GNAT family N-acyltransferase
MNVMEVIRVKTKEQLDAVYAIRTAVFVEEQGVSAELEFDEHETSAEHLLVYWEGEPVGVGRLRIVEQTAKLERICVLAPYRKYGLGKQIIRSLEQMAIEQGLTKAKLHGQTQAEGFYHKLGYTTGSAVFMEDGIPHVLMTKPLSPESADNAN